VQPARGHRWAVYQHIATTLRLHDEAGFEEKAGLPDAVAERDAVLRLVGDAQAVFLALLEIVRHRLNVDVVGSFGAAHDTVHALAVGIVEALERAADRVDGRPAKPMPDLRALRERAEAARAAAPGAAHVQARLLLYRDVVGTLLVLTRDVETRAWTHDRGATLDAATVAPRRSCTRRRSDSGRPRQSRRSTPAADHAAVALLDERDEHAVAVGRRANRSHGVEDRLRARVDAERNPAGKSVLVEPRGRRAAHRAVPRARRLAPG
jgi:hypothetical protein